MLVEGSLSRQRILRRLGSKKIKFGSRKRNTESEKFMEVSRQSMGRQIKKIKLQEYYPDTHCINSPVASEEDKKKQEKLEKFRQYCNKQRQKSSNETTFWDRLSFQSVKSFKQEERDKIATAKSNLKQAEELFSKYGINEGSMGLKRTGRKTFYAHKKLKKLASNPNNTEHEINPQREKWLDSYRKFNLARMNQKKRADRELKLNQIGEGITTGANPLATGKRILKGKIRPSKSPHKVGEQIQKIRNRITAKKGRHAGKDFETVFNGKN